jgi:hypothetical protein
MATSQVSPGNGQSGPEIQKIEKVYKFIDLSTMKEQSKTVKVDFIPAVSVEEGLARLTEDKHRLSAINSQLRRLALFEERKAAIEGGAPRGVVLKMAVPFRAMPPFSGLLQFGPNGKATVESKRAQTKAIMEAFAANPMILEMLKAKVAELGADDDDDEEGTEE